MKKRNWTYRSLRATLLFCIYTVCVAKEGDGLKVSNMIQTDGLMYDIREIAKSPQLKTQERVQPASQELSVRQKEVVWLNNSTPIFQRLKLCGRIRDSFLPHVGLDADVDWKGLVTVPYFCMERKNVSISTIVLGQKGFLLYATMKF